MEHENAGGLAEQENTHGGLEEKGAGIEEKEAALRRQSTLQRSLKAKISKDKEDLIPSDV